MRIQNYTDITYLVKKVRIKDLLENASRERMRLTPIINKKLLKTSLIWTSLIVNFITLFFLIFYHNQNFPNQDANKNDVNKNLLSQKTQVLNTVVPVSPVRLIIPKIYVNADIKYVGVTPEGAMDVPDNIADVGWFKLGPRPGEKGTAVISGHLDGKNGEAGVFADLYKLKNGDKLYIKDNKGKSITFVVREKQTYDPGYADYVFSQSDSSHLILITCDGVWDGAKKSYSKRLVIFTDLD